MLQPIKGAVNRRFRPSSYRQNDNIAKETIISCLEKNGHELVTREEGLLLLILPALKMVQRITLRLK